VTTTPDPSTTVIRAPTISVKQGTVSPRHPPQGIAAGADAADPALLASSQADQCPASHPRSTMTNGGTGRRWVRGQSCKLTGCMTAIDGESFPPEASGPRA
jgi:hypothetical protein